MCVLSIKVSIRKKSGNLLYAPRKTQQHSKCRLYGDRDKTINHISECGKLAQKEYKTRHDRMGKVIHREMCKKFKFDHMNKWYMHKPAAVLENDTHKPLWDIDIQTNRLISARRPDLIIINKILKNRGLCCPGWPQNKTEKKKKKKKKDVKRGISTSTL